MKRSQEFVEDATKAFQKNLNPGTISGMLLTFEGTAKAGQTGTLENLGTMVMKRRGATYVDRPVSFFSEVTDLLGGAPIFDSTEAGAFVATVFVEFSLPSFRQAYNVVDQEEFNFRYQPSADVNTVFDNLTLTGYSLIKDLPEAYQLLILGDDQQPSGAVSSKPYQLNQKNVALVFVKDLTVAPVLTEIGLKQDGAQKFDVQPVLAYKAQTLYTNKKESDDFDLLELECYTEGVASSIRNDISTLQLTTTGSGNIQVTTYSVITGALR